MSWFFQGKKMKQLNEENIKIHTFVKLLVKKGLLLFIQFWWKIVNPSECHKISEPI